MARYLRLAALALILTLALAAGTAIGMDPYDYWGVPRIVGLNAKRPGSVHLLPMTKRRQYARLSAQTLVAGNSRVQVGIDPLAPQWPKAARPVYNYGLAGRATPGVAVEVLAALQRHRPATLYLGVDVIDFFVSEAVWRKPKQPIGPARPGRLNRLEGLAETTLSVNALIDAIGSLAEQGPESADITPLGVMALDDYRGIARREGYYAIFSQRDVQNFNKFSHLPKRVRWPGPGSSANWNALDAIVQACARDGVKLVLFTYPYHAHLLMGVERYGLLPGVFEFKRLLAGYALAHGLPLYDFTRLNAATEEPVPLPGDRRSVTHWFWEAGHFKTALGDRMIAVMADGTTDAEIGGPLTPDGVDVANAALAAELHRYAATPEAGRLAPLFAEVDRGSIIQIRR